MYTHEKAEALAICLLIDRALKEGYPNTMEGKQFMKLARDWMKDNQKENIKDN